MTTIYDFSAERMDGMTQNFSDYKDQVLLIVNTASKCGFTPQFEGLEALYQQYKDQGLVIIGFPCNQFGNQDPANNDEIGAFCQKNYGVSFPMMAKVDVNGSDAHRVFEWLKNQKGGLLTDGTNRNTTIQKNSSMSSRYIMKSAIRSQAIAHSANHCQNKRLFFP